MYTSDITIDYMDVVCNGKSSSTLQSNMAKNGMDNVLCNQYED